jgi:UDP-N-acetylmuramate--alanine ligase
MKNSTIYFLGIGGIGMSALAQYFLSEHYAVYGYDRTPSPITDMLVRKGARIHFEPDIAKIPQALEFAVYTPAVPESNPEFCHLRECGVPLYKRSQVLGHITERMPAIAVAGTHGKTTSTAMVSHLLSPETRILAFIGGIAKNFNDNFVLDEHPVIAVAEADEFDRSFLTMHPSVAVITAADADHLDIYGNREQMLNAFRQFALQSKILIVEETIAGLFEHPCKRTYGTGTDASYSAFDLRLSPNCATFSLRMPDGREIRDLILHANGRYNILNATAAIATLIEQKNLNTTLPIDVSDEHIINKLKTFAGVKRRFDYIVNQNGRIFIDDYAHHPQEIQSFITAVRSIYPGKHVCGIFQPHLYSRTRDFAEQFAEVLSELDETLLLPIYPARELPIPGIDSEHLAALIKNPCKRVIGKTELIPYLKQHTPDVLLTIGAGDIDRLIPQIKREVYGCS